MIKVEYIDHLGSDLTVVNAARVSFGGNKSSLDEKDMKLIKYLAEHEHMSPFEHCSLTVKIDCPIYISKQIMRHRTGKFNEISRRYTDKDITFYIPDTLRKQHESNRQASDGDFDEPLNSMVIDEIRAHQAKCLDLYKTIVDLGICKEQARGVLSQDLMTEFYMTMDLRNLVHFIKLRQHEGAQVEVQVIAEQIKEILLDKFGYSAKVLLDKGL